MGTATLANNFLAIKFESKSTSEKVALSDFGTRIMKVVQVTHHQGDIRYVKGYTVLIDVIHVNLLNII